MGEFSARPPGMQELATFLLAEIRAGNFVGECSIDTDCRQKL